VDRSWRRDQEAEEAESQLSKQLERVQLIKDESGGSATGSSNDNKKGDSESAGEDEEQEEEEEVEEWELALDNSDEDSVPKAPAPESKPMSKPVPAAPPKIGNWSDGKRHRLLFFLNFQICNSCPGLELNSFHWRV